MVVMAAAGCSAPTDTPSPPSISTPAPSSKHAVTLADIAAKERVAIPELLRSFDGAIADIRIYDYGSGIAMDFVFAPQDTPVVLYPEDFEARRPQMQQLLDSDLLATMLRAGVSKPEVRITYLNPDESEIWSGLFRPSR